MKHMVSSRPLHICLKIQTHIKEQEDGYMLNGSSRLSLSTGLLLSKPFNETDIKYHVTIEVQLKHMMYSGRLFLHIFSK
jgi:hypothetical protein